MKVLAREQVKSLLAQKGIKLKDLASKMEELSGEKCSANYLSRKLSRGSISYNDVLLIAEILGYDIQFVNNNNELI